MARMYIVNHWNDAAAYSGEQIGDRLKDSTALHFNRDGSANVELYSEETALAKKKSSVSIEDKILPQAARLRRLTEQLIELEQAKKAGMNIDKYSQLRDVLIVKRNRCEVLLKKALAVKPPIQEDEDSLEFDDQYTQDSVENSTQNSVHNRVDDSSAPEWLKGINPDNSVRNFLVRGCAFWAKAVQFSSRAKAYIKTLSEV